jgi:hypothetical protein
LDLDFRFGGNLRIRVDEIPNSLKDDEDGEISSNHASKMFTRANQDVRLWFRDTLMLPLEWNLEHPDDTRGGSNSFHDYRADFPLEFKIWDIQGGTEGTQRVSIYTDNGRSITVSGRADFLITRRYNGLHLVKVDWLDKVLGVIELQSNSDAIQCEYQMLAYLFIMMNARGLRNLVGFLVYNDGQCRAYRASRGVNGNAVYEENDRFHVSYIAEIFVRLVNEAGM